MSLTYDSTLDDVVETAFRLYQRGRTYQTNRWIGTALCTVAFAILAFLGFKSAQNINLPVLIIIAGGWGAGIYLFGYKRSIRYRITQYIATEMNGAWPRATSIEIHDGKLISTSAGASTTYPLGDLTGIIEDSKRIELVFDDGRLFVIPLRAFDSTDEKNAFLAALPRS